MNENNKEIISKNVSLAPLSTGLASRGLQVANQLAQRSKRDFTNSIGMKLVLIPKGTFQMGSPIEEEERYEDEVQHEVTISQDYYLGVTAVTQGQYEKVMGNNPSNFQCHQSYKVQGDSSNRPVERVSWKEVVEFCKRLSELPEETKAGRVYRLPTEAEWEYACRAGTSTKFSFGESRLSLGDFAWFDENSDMQTHPVGEKKPNSWGLYDMHGNVWELCSDWVSDYPKLAVTDPIGPNEGSLRVGRGGSWYNVAAFCRSGVRDVFDWWGSHIGFRVALSSSGMFQSPEVDR
jgi:formylglycine-generating enzyme required for sulfatase activity